MTGGWIKAHRQMTDSAVFSDPFVFRLWMLCLFKATHKPRKITIGSQIVELQPGQFVTGRHALADEYNETMKRKRDRVPESTIWRWLMWLKEWGNLNIKTNNKFSVVTIVNWGIYQSDDSEMDSKMNHKWTANEQQMDTNKNERIKESIPTTTIPSDFHLVATAYQKAYGKYLTPIQLDELNQLIDKHGMESELLAYGIEKAGKTGAAYTYAVGIFNSWIDKGIRNKEQALNEEQEHQREKDELESRRQQRHGQPPKQERKPRYSKEELGW